MFTSLFMTLWHNIDRGNRLTFTKDAFPNGYSAKNNRTKSFYWAGHFSIYLKNVLLVVFSRQTNYEFNIENI